MSAIFGRDLRTAGRTGCSGAWRGATTARGGLPPEGRRQHSLHHARYASRGMMQNRMPHVFFCQGDAIDVALGLCQTHAYYSALSMYNNKSTTAARRSGIFFARTSDRMLFFRTSLIRRRTTRAGRKQTERLTIRVAFQEQRAFAVLPVCAYLSQLAYTYKHGVFLVDSSNVFAAMLSTDPCPSSLLYACYTSFVFTPPPPIHAAGRIGSSPTQPLRRPPVEHRGCVSPGGGKNRFGERSCQPTL